MSSEVRQPVYDVVILGGGLSGVLAACRLKSLRQDVGLLLIERGAALGGNHTWSFYETDVTPGQSEWLSPFVVKSWPALRVRFPSHERRIATGYRSITSERLAEVGMARLEGAVLSRADVASADHNRVVLTDGRTFQAQCVIDCRGASPDDALMVGHQKFVGREIVTRHPHGVEEPVIMDADVPQLDGYRFVYVLPLDTNRLLIEDTYYSDDADIDIAALAARVDGYCKMRGWDIDTVVREEYGVLPIALGGDIDAFWANRRSQSPCAQAGMRAALFHPTTGYSLPDAVALADALAAFAPLETRAVADFIEQRSRRLWRERAFFRMLNRMLFLAAAPEQRWRVLQRFYRLSPDLIGRFYAAQLTAFDKARILIGMPPISVLKALRAMPESSLEAWRSQRVNAIARL